MPHIELLDMGYYFDLKERAIVLESWVKVTDLCMQPIYAVNSFFVLNL